MFEEAHSQKWTSSGIFGAVGLPPEPGSWLTGRPRDALDAVPVRLGIHGIKAAAGRR